MDKLPNRKNVRLQEFNYSQNGAYFVTICTKDRQNIFWNNINDFVGADIIRPKGVPLNPIGKVVEYAIEQISEHYECVSVEKYVIMPNHIHLILLIDRDTTNGRIISAPTISIIIGQMKRWVSKQISFPVWQKSFYDHIIRNRADYDRIWQYIDENPAKWELDEYYTE